MTFSKSKYQQFTLPHVTHRSVLYSWTVFCKAQTEQCPSQETDSQCSDFTLAFMIMGWGAIAGCCNLVCAPPLPSCLLIIPDPAGQSWILHSPRWSATLPGDPGHMTWISGSALFFNCMRFLGIYLPNGLI